MVLMVGSRNSTLLERAESKFFCFKSGENMCSASREIAFANITATESKKLCGRDVRRNLLPFRIFTRYPSHLYTTWMIDVQSQLQGLHVMHSILSKVLLELTGV